MKTLKILFFVLVATLFLSKISLGATLTACASECDYSTIQAAINAASAGDIVKVSAGSYNETLTINKSLTLKAASCGDDAANPTCDFTQTTFDTNGIDDASPILLEGTVGNVTIMGFTIWPATNSAAIESTEEAHSGINISYNKFKASNQSYILMKTTWTSSLVKGNIFHGGGGGAFQMWDTGHVVEITNNVFYNTGCFQISDNNSVGLINNIFYNSQINLTEGSTQSEGMVISRSHNCYYGTDVAVQISGDANGTDTDPAFKSDDEASDDYFALEDYSACAIGGKGGEDYVTYRGAIPYSGTHVTTINVPGDISTIAGAIAAAGASYTINIAPGDYTLSEMINIQVANLKLLGGGRGDAGDEEATTTLTADFNGGVIQVSDGASGAIIGDDPSTELVTGLRINAQSTEDGPAVIMVQDDATIQNCFIFGSTNEDVFKGVEVNSQGDAVTATIHNNIIVQAGRSVFLNGQQGLTNATITNNTMYGGYLGFQIDTSGTVTFKNNIVANHAQAGVSGWDGPTVTATYTNSYNNNDQDWPNDETEEATGNISEDPLFYAAASNDFRIIEEVSPCYETGESSANMGALLTPVAQFSPVYADSSAAAGGDGSLANPVSSIITCVNLTLASEAEPGICNVAGSETAYSENVILKSDMTLQKEAGSSGNATINCGSSGSGITISGNDNVNIEDMTITNCPAGNGIAISASSSGIFISNTTITNSATTKSGQGVILSMSAVVKSSQSYATTFSGDEGGSGIMVFVDEDEDPEEVSEADTVISGVDENTVFDLALVHLSVTPQGQDTVNIYESWYISQDALEPEEGDTMQDAFEDYLDEEFLQGWTKVVDAYVSDVTSVSAETLDSTYGITQVPSSYIYEGYLPPLVYGEVSYSDDPSGDCDEDELSLQSPDEEWGCLTTDEQEAGFQMSSAMEGDDVDVALVSIDGLGNLTIYFAAGTYADCVEFAAADGNVSEDDCDLFIPNVITVADLALLEVSFPAGFEAPSLTRSALEYPLPPTATFEAGSYTNAGISISASSDINISDSTLTDNGIGLLLAATAEDVSIEESAITESSPGSTDYILIKSLASSSELSGCGNDYNVGDIVGVFPDLTVSCDPVADSPAAVAEDCDDGLDNDSDGDIDYCDSDCVAECTGTIVALLCSCVATDAASGGTVAAAETLVLGGSSAVPAVATDGGAVAAAPATGGGKAAGPCTFRAEANNQMGSLGMLFLIVLIGLAALRRKLH